MNMNYFKYGFPVPNTWYIFLKPDTLERKAVAMNLTAQQRLLDLFGRQSVVRSLDLEQYEIPRVLSCCKDILLMNNTDTVCILWGGSIAINGT
jgi:hypothetical protein